MYNAHRLKAYIQSATCQEKVKEKKTSMTVNFTYNSCRIVITFADDCLLSEVVFGGQLLL